jgi:hypothetical protein
MGGMLTIILSPKDEVFWLGVSRPSGVGVFSLKLLTFQAPEQSSLFAQNIPWLRRAHNAQINPSPTNIIKISQNLLQPHLDPSAVLITESQSDETKKYIQSL